MIEESALIDLPKGDADRKYIEDKVTSYFNLEMEIDSAKDSQSLLVTDVHEFYKNKVDEKTKKGDVSAMIKSFVAELKEGKITQEVEKKENHLALLDTIKKNLDI